MLERETIYTALILHDGWEMDNVVWVDEYSVNGKKVLMTTSHGVEYPMSQKEIDLHILKTQKSLEELITARDMVFGEDK